MSDIERAKGTPLRCALHLSIVRDAVRLEIQLLAQGVTPARSSAYKRGQSRFTLPSSPIELPITNAALANLLLGTWQDARRKQQSRPDHPMSHLAAEIEQRALEAQRPLQPANQLFALARKHRSGDDLERSWKRRRSGPDGG